MKAAIPLLILLAACGPQSPQPTNETEPTAPASKPAPPPARPFVDEEKNELIDFHFSWSAEAAAVPELVDRFQKELKQIKAATIEDAREGKANSAANGFEFQPYMLSTDYTTAGQSDRLLSLRDETGSYTGGAHGNSGTGALLWDRASSRELKIADLFAAPANMERLLTQPWCDALNQEREKKRGEPVGGGGMFDDCPKLEEIALIPADADGNGRFEKLMLVAAPYVAGPWVEGSYEIELPVSSDLIAALKGDYKASFEAAQPQ